jgi:hypothetical protein
MSDIRDKARNILDLALPPNTVINSDGATAGKYTEMTGLSQKVLQANWDKGGIMTGCNGFTGWFGRKMGAQQYLGGFDLKHICAGAGKPDAWVVSTSDNAPDYGDILRHASFHVDVCLGFERGMLMRAAGGQGGKSAGHDIIKRIKGTDPYDWKKLVGWIDIETFFADDDDPYSP